MTMLRIISLIAALLVSWSACAQIPLTGAGKGAPGGASPFSITETATDSSVTSTATYTFSNENIGAADPTRTVCTGFGWQTGPLTVTGVTFGGVSATHVTNSLSTNINGANSDIWCLGVAAGTTSTIVVSLSGSASRMSIAVYSIVGTGSSVSSGANNNSGTSVSTLSTSGTIPASGGAIAIMNIHTATPGAITPTNLSTDSSVVFGSSTLEAGKNTSSSGATTMGYAWAGTAADATLSIATFNP